MRIFIKNLHKKVILFLSMMLCLFLSSCVNLTGMLYSYDSKKLPPDIQTSEITFRNLGADPIDAAVTDDYHSCLRLAYVASYRSKVGRKLNGYEFKTIKFPSKTINTTTLEFYEHTVKGLTEITITASYTFSFYVEQGKHYYIDFFNDRINRKLNVSAYNLEPNGKKKTIVIRRNRKWGDFICTPLTKTEETYLTFKK